MFNCMPLPETTPEHEQEILLEPLPSGGIFKMTRPMTRNRFLCFLGLSVYFAITLAVPHGGNGKPTPVSGESRRGF